MPIIIPSTTTAQLGTGPTLNTVDANGVVWRMLELTGWGEPGTDLNPQKNVRARGTYSGDAYTLGRVVTASGMITAPTPALLNAAIDALINAVTTTAFSLTVTESGVPSTAIVKRQGETLTPKITNLTASYSIQVYADDSRKFGTALTGSTGLPSSSGGLGWPHTWPEGWGATTTPGTVTLTNPGNTTGSVLLRIDGPVGGPQVTHAGTGQPVLFASSLVLGAGEFLLVDMDNHQTLANGQANRAQYITAPGWSGFDPGVNSWAFSAAAPNVAALLTVTATPAKK